LADITRSLALVALVSQVEMDDFRVLGTVKDLAGPEALNQVA
jgi:hypothetical protein